MGRPVKISGDHILPILNTIVWYSPNCQKWHIVHMAYMSNRRGFHVNTHCGWADTICKYIPRSSKTKMDWPIDCCRSLASKVNHTAVRREHRTLQNWKIGIDFDICISKFRRGADNGIKYICSAWQPACNAWKQNCIHAVSINHLLCCDGCVDFPAPWVYRYDIYSLDFAAVKGVHRILRDSLLHYIRDKWSQFFFTGA